MTSKLGNAASKAGKPAAAKRTPARKSAIKILPAADGPRQISHKQVVAWVEKVFRERRRTGG